MKDTTQIVASASDSGIAIAGIIVAGVIVVVFILSTCTTFFDRH